MKASLVYCGLKFASLKNHIKDLLESVDDQIPNALFPVDLALDYVRNNRLSLYDGGFKLKE